jgi:hypothetical protein
MRTPPTQPASSERTLDSLLQPSLGGTSAEPLYSVRAGFLVSFFGGVYAAALFGALNARRMGRLAEDGWICALAVVAWSAVIVWVGYGIATDSLPAWLSFVGRPARSVRYGGQLVALALFGALHLRRRTEIKAQQLAGVEPPNPWPIGLLAVGVSFVLSMLFLGAGMVLGRD